MDFSIIVATKGRVELLVDLIKSIDAARKNYRNRCEVLIVDDSSPEETIQVQVVCQKYDCKYIRYESTVSAKRNYGASLATHDLLLFLDSDCVATENILNEYLKFYEKINVVAAAGPLQFVGEDTWFWKAIEASPYVTCFVLPKYLERLEWGVTANFSVRKKIFKEVRGFDENFRRPAGEDVDLGLRIRDAGYEIAGACNALVYHSKSTWIPFRSMIKRLHFYGSADYDLTIKHSNRSEIVLPKRVLNYCVLFFWAVMTCICIQNAWPLLVWVGIILFENLAVSILVNRLSEEKKASISQQLMAQFLIHDNESAYLMRCLRTFNWKAIPRQMIYYLGQYRGMMSIGMISSWISFATLTIILIFIAVFIW